MKQGFWALLALSGAVIATPAPAANIIYNFSQNIGGTSVTGQITTDGTIGNVTTGHVVDYSIRAPRTMAILG